MAAPSQSSEPSKTILSIDGGGIRGVIPAIVLSEIERLTGQPIAKLFDVVAGTSTGGILALGLSCPNEQGAPRFTAAELAEMYRRDGQTIFPHECLGKILQLFGPKYPEGGRRKVLEDHFQETRLSEALTEVIVPSYDIEGRNPVFFRRASARERPQTHDFAMRDVALATSAAPTYFKPVRLPGGESSGDMVLVDGGVYANNPGMCGFVDESAARGQPAGTLMVSLGTGELTKPLSYARSKRWGLIGWGLHVLDVVFDGVTEAVDYELAQVLGSGYHRYQVTLAESEQAMDDAKAANISNLEASARKMVNEREADLQALCQELLNRRASTPLAPPTTHNIDYRA